MHRSIDSRLTLSVVLDHSLYALSCVSRLKTRRMPTVHFVSQRLLSPRFMCWASITDSIKVEISRRASWKVLSILADIWVSGKHVINHRRRMISLHVVPSFNPFGATISVIGLVAWWMRRTAMRFTASTQRSVTAIPR